LPPPASTTVQELQTRHGIRIPRKRPQRGGGAQGGPNPDTLRTEEDRPPARPIDQGTHIGKPAQRRPESLGQELGGRPGLRLEAGHPLPIEEGLEGQAEGPPRLRLGQGGQPLPDPVKLQDAHALLADLIALHRSTPPAPSPGPGRAPLGTPMPFPARPKPPLSGPTPGPPRPRSPGRCGPGTRDRSAGTPPEGC